MFTINLNIASSNTVRAMVRYSIEEDTLLGHESRSWTQEENIALKPGAILGKTEVMPSIHGQKVTTMVVEGLDGLGLNLSTDTSERASIFGTHSTTVVRIQSSIESMLGTPRVSRPLPGRQVDEVRISVRATARPRARFGF
jgi:hypothetical protein